MRRLLLPVLFVLVGCTADPSPSSSATPATTRPAVSVPADRILIQLQTVGCGCQFGQVEFEWLKLPGVGAVQWELQENRVWLVFIDGQRPTDEAIRTAIADFDVGIASIHRPPSAR